MRTHTHAHTHKHAQHRTRTHTQFLEEDESSKLKEVFDTANIFRLRPVPPKEHTEMQSFRQLKVCVCCALAYGALMVL
jgi:hypothetical protein